MRRRGAPSAASSSRTRQRAARGRAEGAAADKHCLLTRIEDWRAAGEVHGEFFRDVRPVNTTMQVTRFVDPDWLVEVEVDAVAGGE